MTNTKKKSVLDMKLFKAEEINKNDIVFAVAYIIHKYKINLFDEDFLQFINLQHHDYLLDILYIIPDRCREVKEQVLNRLGPVPQQRMRKLLEVFRNDGEFCRFVIEQNEYHKHAADQGLSA